MQKSQTRCAKVVISIKIINYIETKIKFNSKKNSTKKTMKKQIYLEPAIEEIEMVVEAGIAQSQFPDVDGPLPDDGDDF